MRIIGKNLLERKILLVLDRAEFAPGLISWRDLANTPAMAITPEAIQDLLDELEASKQSRLRAWNVLQRLRSLLSDLGNVAIPVRRTPSLRKP
jgi:hypothetical protein